MPPGLEELAEQFDGYHRDTTAAIESLTANVEQLSERFGNMVRRPAEARGNGIATPINQQAQAEAETRAAFVQYLRTGEINTRAVITSPDSAGGFAVPDVVDAQIRDILISVSPIRSIARVVQVSNVGEISFVVGRRGAASSWADEMDTRSVTASPVMAAVSPPGGELFSLCEVSTFFLEDAIADGQDWVLRNLADEHAVKEGLSFISGSGIKQPLGILSGPAPVTTSDATRAFGTIQYTASGAAADFATSNPVDNLINLVFSLAAPYRLGARWLMSSSTAGAVRKLKVTGGSNEYIWQPSTIAGQPDFLLGYPVTIAEDMPAIGANAFPILFGNFERGYVIVDKRGSTLLRDPYTRKGFVQFFMNRRVHGIMTDSNAIKVFKIAAA